MIDSMAMCYFKIGVAWQALSIETRHIKIKQPVTSKLVSHVLVGTLTRRDCGGTIESNVV